MNKLILITLFVFWTVSNLSAETNGSDINTGPDSTNTARSYTSLSLSPDLDMKSGSESIIAINHGLSLVEDKAIGTKWFSEKSFQGKIGGMTARFAKYVFLDMPRHYFAAVVAHEYWGHGARYRELDINNIDYGYDAPPPYGDGGGHATAHISDPITYVELISIMTAGFEVQEVINRRLNLRFMSKKEIYYQEALQYFESFRIMSDYMQETANDLNSNEDAAVYVKFLNLNAGYDTDNPKIDVDYVKKRYYLNMANPFLIYSLYTIVGPYLWDGNDRSRIPTIHAGGFEYLPSLRVAMAPFGLEYHIENYLYFKGKSALIDLRFGDQKFYDSWGGIGILIQNAYMNDRHALDIDLNLWKQPGMMLGRAEASLKGEGVGGALAIRYHYEFSKVKPIASFFVELGYKSAGFIEGYDLDAAPIILLGFGYRN